MRAIKRIAVVGMLCGLVAANSATLLAEADQRKPKSEFSAGNQIIQGGEIVGCMCPRDRGPCVCQYVSEQ